MLSLLGALAARGPWVLVAGIVAGIALPGLAADLVPYIPHMVAGLLFLAALRIGPARMWASLTDVPRSLALLLVLQLAFPLMLVAVFGALGLLGSVFVLALLLIAMASPISGSPNMVAMMGFDPASTMRLLILGTLILPLTSLPVLYLVPALGDLQTVIAAALRLVVVILGSGAVAFALRAILPEPGLRDLKAIDGASALLLAIVVIGLMAAVNDALWTQPGTFALWTLFVCVVNFGLQAVGYIATGKPGITVIAGNRNIALFLVALPAEVMAPLLIFVGCYQVPMYLTPLITGRILKALDRAA
ncbi:hypothetical protein C8N43_3638 [Litoreibacter ponti]|uniref:BASS family bile acid:Na+ symporter n=1 Tax=Litoreibacter ponti TaxID=1510457 RepID=A0A2T6BFI7_9RHOB|nr:hypothetical protein [Litoreibacter ponti]PTX54817.1 hypothetical protein C8N43_3638 [Litoreibacter ponti]